MRILDVCCVPISFVTFIFSEVYAQDATQVHAAQQSNAISSEKIQKVEVVGQSVSELARTEALSRSIISQEVLTRFGDANILDALKRVPGILVIEDRLQLVGIDGVYTQVLIDGQPPRGITIAQLPLNSIERVEIFRSGNAQFSAQAIGGTINIILKKVASTSQRKLKLGAAYAYKESETFDWLTSEKVGALAYSFSLSGGEIGASSSMPFSTATEVFNLEGATTERYAQSVTRSVENKHIRLAPRVQFQTEAGTDFSITSSFGITRRDASQDEQFRFFLGTPFRIARIAQTSDSKRENGTISAKIARKFGENNRLEATVGISGTNAQSDVLEETYDLTNLGVFVRNLYATSRNRGINTSGKIAVPTKSGHEFVVGWEGSVDRARWDRKEIYTEGAVGEGSSNQYTASRISKFDFFAQDEWKLNEHISAYVGGRVEAVKIDAEEASILETGLQSRIFSPIGQVLWMLNSENTDRLRFAASRTYRAPSDDQLLAPRG